MLLTQGVAMKELTLAHQFGFLMLWIAVPITMWMMYQKGAWTGIATIVSFGLIFFLVANYDSLKEYGIGKWVLVKAQQKLADAEEILKKLQGHENTIDMIVRDANAAKVKIDSIDVAVANADESLKEISSTQAISTLILRSQLDNLAAFQELEELSEKQNPNTDARRAVEQQIAFTTLNLDNLQSPIDWKAVGGEPKAAKLEDFKRVYKEDTFLSHLAVIQALENRVNDPEVCEYFVGLLDTETSIYAYFKLIQILRAKAKIGEARGYSKADKEKIKQWWRENKLEVASQYEAHLKQLKQWKEEEDERQRVHRAWWDGVERLNKALKEKSFINASVNTDRTRSLTFDYSIKEYTISSQLYRYSVSGTLEELLKRIEEANTDEELNPHFKRESPPIPDDKEAE
jgi:hypothetical protein